MVITPVRAGALGGVWEGGAMKPLLSGYCWDMETSLLMT